MNPTVTRNFGDVPTDDEYTRGFGFDAWSETKESESGVSPITTTQTQIENIWRTNGENIALTSAINQSVPVQRTALTSRDTFASPPLVRSEELRIPSLTPPPSPGSTLNPPKAPKKKPVTIARKQTRSMTLLDSALQTLGTLKLSLQDEVKELEMILQDVHQSCDQAEASLKSQRPTLTRLSSSTRDSLPINNLFAASPVYATKEGYFQHCGCSGSTDPLAPERLALRLKRQETKQFTQNPLETNGGMDIQDNL
jgi:hypothetical protein